jgi:hypothetical protein
MRADETLFEQVCGLIGLAAVRAGESWHKSSISSFNFRTKKATVKPDFEQDSATSHSSRVSLLIYLATDGTDETQIFYPQISPIFADWTICGYSLRDANYGNGHSELNSQLATKAQILEIGPIASGGVLKHSQVP